MCVDGPCYQARECYVHRKVAGRAWVSFASDHPYKKDFLQTAGDRNCYYDGYVSIQCVVGRVVGFKRKDRYVSSDNLVYRLGSFLWRVLFPVRPLLFLFRRRTS